MGWFTRKPRQRPALDAKAREEAEHRYGRAAFGTAIGLYMRTVDEDRKDPSDLAFDLPDSRFRFLVMLLSTVFKACALEIPEGIDAASSALKSLAMLSVNEKQFRFFAGDVTAEEAYESGKVYFIGFTNQWSKIVSAENRDGAGWPEQKRLLAIMLKAVESESDLTDADLARLGPMTLYIDGLQPGVREEFRRLLAHP